MPTLSRLLDKLSVAAPYVKGKEAVPELPTFTTYALWTAPAQHSRRQQATRSPADARAQVTQPALQSVARLAPSDIPPGGVLYALTAPDPASDARTSFLLDCLPDPLGWLAHCALFIRARLDEGERCEWRYNQIELVFENGPGLAATSGGLIKVSMQWIGSLMAHVRDGGRSRASATREIKGVLLHELVHTIQYDGQHNARSTAPSWLIESIADFIRLQAHLGPPHWRKAGQGREERGWEDGYDAGARFFAWLEDWVDPSHAGGSKWAEKERERVLAGVTVAARFGTLSKGKRLGQKSRPFQRPSSGGSSSSGSGSGTRTPTQASTSRAQVGKEPLFVVLNDEDDPPVQDTEGISRMATPTQASTRRGFKEGQASDIVEPTGPWPGIIGQLNRKLRSEAYNEAWWAELTGEEGGLDVLWARYLGDYRI